MAALVMIAALLLLVSGNYWAYGFKKEKKAAMAATSSSSDEQTDDAPTVPNPTEEKTPKGLQNISEYLHDHSYSIEHPVAVTRTSYYDGFDRLPVHHPELLTPPPKRA